MRVCPLLILGLATACSSGSSNDNSTLLASATIGSEGGVLTVDSGLQAGLRLTVPAGALLTPTEIRIRDATTSPAVGTLPVSAPEPPGRPLRFEPLGLRLEERATLRLPYLTTRVLGTSPGNVRVREVRNGFAIDNAPEVVDVSAGFVELPIRFLVQYNVIAGPAAASLGSYLPLPTQSPLQLTNDATFAAENVPETSPFFAAETLRWRLTGASSPSPQPVDLLYFREGQVVGRESVPENWREQWSVPFPFQSTVANVLPGGAAMTMPMDVFAPASQPAIGGQLTAYGLWSYGAPRRIGDTMLYDIAQWRLSLAWNRADLGVGQREYAFLFAAGIGLIGYVQDGVEHLRTSL